MTDVSERPDDEAPRWLDEASNVRKVYLSVWVVCIALLVGGEVLLQLDRSGHPGELHGFGFERWPGFYSLYGFVACGALVLAAKQLRKLLMRDENYYEGQDGP